MSVACADFPRIWPSPTNPRIRLLTGGGEPSWVAIPVAAPGGLDGPAPPAPDASVNRAPATVSYEPRWTIEHDLAAGAVGVRAGVRFELRTPGRDGTLALDHAATARVARERPDGASVRAETRIGCRTPAGELVEVETQSQVSAGGAVLGGRVRSGGHCIFERRWEA